MYFSQISVLSVAALAAFMPSSPAPDGGGPCPPNSVQETATHVASFGPEIGDWSNETLSVPKFVDAPDTTLVQVDIEICGRIDGEVSFQNNDDNRCLLTYTVEADAQVVPQDPASPVSDFQLHVGVAGGPILLDPGEGGGETFDSGLVCDPVRSFTSGPDLAFFIASPMDEDVVFEHAGVTNSDHVGCGVLDFTATVFSELELRVTYTYCRSLSNEPPVCIIEPIDEVECQGDVTIIQLDASASFDPDGTPLQFFWVTNCPNATFDDPNSATPILMIDTSMSCEFSCSVQLRVYDGVYYRACREDFQVVSGDPGSPGLDIKPGSCPNPVNVGSNGVISVGLLGTADFDVSQVNQSTIRLSRVDGVGGEVVPTQINASDVGTPFSGDGCDCHTLTGDGILDLRLRFTKQEVVSVLELDGEPNNSYVELHVTGELLDGTPFESDRDCVRVLNH